MPPPDPSRHPCPERVAGHQFADAGKDIPNKVTFIDAGGDILTATLDENCSNSSYLAYKVTDRIGVHRGIMARCPMLSTETCSEVPHVDSYLYSDMTPGSLTPRDWETESAWTWPHAQRGLLEVLNRELNN